MRTWCEVRNFAWHRQPHFFQWMRGSGVKMKSIKIEMARTKIFQARNAHSLRHSAINRPWTDYIYYLSNRPVHDPLNNWQSCLFCHLMQSPRAILTSEAKYLLRLFCLLWNMIVWSGHVMWQAQETKLNVWIIVQV